jgi:hypothetical protein
MCWHWLMNPIIRCKALWLAPALSTKTSGATLKKLSAIPSSKEFARILHTQPDELGQGATFRQNVRDLSQYGLSFETLDASPWVPEVSNHQRILDARRMGNPHLAEQTVVHITGLFFKAALAVWASR